MGKFSHSVTVGRWAILVLLSIALTMFLLFLNSGCAVIEKPTSALPSIQQAQAVTNNAVAQLDAIAPRIHQEVAEVRTYVLPGAPSQLDGHLNDIAAAASAVAAVSASLKTGVTPALVAAAGQTKATEKALTAETKRADAAEERASSLIRRILAIVAVFGLLAGVAVIAYGVYSKSKKIGMLGGAVIAAGAASAALYQFYSWVVWAGLAILAATMGYLVYMLFRQTGVAKELVGNVETIKATLTPSQTATLFAVGSVPDTQSPATKALVAAVKPST